MRKFFTSLIAVFVVVGLQAQQQHAPKLVVCITIDQLRGDYLDYFKGIYGEHGFKRLMNDGTSFRHVQFEFSSIDQASAFATIFTGANPCYHSITGNKRYDFEKELEQSCIYDAYFLGNYTTQSFSPKNLLSSTIGSELKYASKGVSKVYAIAPEAESAVLSAGHAADGAFWIDNYNGKWVTTTYYKKDIPPYVDKFNSGSESLSSRLSSITWSPMLATDQYDALPYIADKKSYRYTFNEKEFGCYPRFKTSPFINKEVSRLAIEFINSDDIGVHPTPDMLLLTLYGGNFLDVQDKTYTQEIQDIYYQLDQSIADILNAIDKKIGLDKTLVVVTGTGYYTDTEMIPEGLNAAGGTFYPKRTTAVLQMFLRHQYGAKDWISGYYNQQIFLNRKLIEDEKIDLATIQLQAAEFIAPSAGVQQVVTDFSLRNGDWNEGNATLRYGTHHTGRGDLIIELAPGWGIDNETTGQKTNVKRNNAVVTPLIFFGNGLKPTRIERTVYATEIAPTISNFLRIRAPNACNDLPLPEVRK